MFPVEVTGDSAEGRGARREDFLSCLSHGFSGEKFFFFLIFPCPDVVNPTKTFDWSRDYVLRFQPLSASGVNFLLELK